MRNTTLIVLVAALLSAAACHKNNQAEQLAALDNAYKTGVFSKEEYDTRKQALFGVGAPKAPAQPAQSPQTEPVAAQPVEQPAPPAASVPPPAPVRDVPRSTAPPPAQPAARRMPSTPAPAQADVPPPAPVPVRPAPPANGANREDSEPAPLAGCEDAESKSGGAKGVQERFFPVPVDAVRKAAALAFKNLDFTIHSDTSREMEASKRRHVSAVVGAGGERLILRFESAQRGGQSGTRVTGETKKSFVGRLAQKTWTTAVLAQIACNLRTGRR
jgi:outer membrane biosynthesis protein TonB